MNRLRAAWRDASWWVVIPAGAAVLGVAWVAYVGWVGILGGLG